MTIGLMKPEIVIRPGIYRLTWREPPIVIECRRLRQHRDGRLSAYIKVSSAAGHLHGADFNLSSTATRSTLAKALTERYETDWYAILEQLCHYVREAFEQGEPAQEIWSGDDPGPLKYLIRPLLPLGQASIIFGDGGSMKSTLGQLLSLIAFLPWEDNSLGLIAPSGVTPCLYLDWEADEDEFKWRLHALGQGMRLPNTPLRYRRMSLPLADDLESVSNIVNEFGIQFVVLDSLGAAAGGDLNATEPCFRFFAALRQLHVTSLILAHNSKDQLTKKKTVYGNVHYWNYARSVWETRKSQEDGAQEVDLALFHRKWNRQHFSPVAFKFVFAGDDSLEIRRQDVRNMDSVRDQLTIGARILIELRSGALSKPALDACLEDVKPAVIASTLIRLKRAEKIVSLSNNLWGLAAPKTESLF